MIRIKIMLENLINRIINVRKLYMKSIRSAQIPKIMSDWNI